MDRRIPLVQQRIEAVEQEIAEWRKHNSISCPTSHQEYTALKKQLDELRKVLTALNKKVI